MSVTAAPLAETAAALRAGERTATDYVEAICDRVEAVDPEVRALLPEEGRRERLTAAATLLERRHDGGDRPPLYGVPVGVKDVFHVDGMPTRAGSDVPPSELAGEESRVVEALREAGGLVLGKTHTTEFTFGATPPTRNPHDTGHTPGGSSAGSAAAVAAGLCPVALGTQTGGSVVRPAAFCGIVGFKPSLSRIPTAGLLHVAPSIDHVGLMTQDVAGMAPAADVFVPDWDGAADPTSLPTLGVPASSFLDRASEEGRARFRDHLDALAEAGFEVRDVPALDDFDDVETNHQTLATAEGALEHYERYQAYGDRYAEPTAGFVERGFDVEMGELAAARRRALDLRAELAERMDEHGVDCYVTPAAPGPAPEGIEGCGDPVMNVAWTYAGMPAVTVPAGTAGNGLPVGLQCVARFGDDERLLGWADPVAAALGD